LRGGIAKLVETGGADPEFYASLVNQIAEQHRKSRDIERCKRLGYAVQEAVKQAFESYGLELELVDRGFDYEVTASSDNVLEDFATRIQFGSYLLEVKATTKFQARLTPTQAEMASKESFRYVLCVVDLSDLSDEELDANWTGDRIEPLAKVITNIGDGIKETCELVEMAKTNSVSIRNDSALRYEVPMTIWQTGRSIPEWVASILRTSR
jgi:hypothetical protein